MYRHYILLVMIRILLYFFNILLWNFCIYIIRFDFLNHLIHYLSLSHLLLIILFLLIFFRDWLGSYLCLWYDFIGFFILIRLYILYYFFRYLFNIWLLFVRFYNAFIIGFVNTFICRSFIKLYLFIFYWWKITRKRLLL